MAQIHVLLAIFAFIETTAQALPDACQRIQNAISNSSDVYCPGSDNYTRDVYHWSEASMRPSLCSVEPGTTEDVGITLQILSSTQTRSAVLHFSLVFSWSSETSDDLFFQSLRQSAAHLTNVAVADGQADVRDASLYPNYALYDVPIERNFGNYVERLRKIKARVDPDDVMALTGGFKL